MLDILETFRSIIHNRNLTVDWNLVAAEFFLRIFEIAKNTITKNFNGYMVIIVVMSFRKNISIKVSWHFRKYFSAQNNSSLQLVNVWLGCDCIESSSTIETGHPISKEACGAGAAAARARSHRATMGDVTDVPLRWLLDNS